MREGHCVYKGPPGLIFSQAGTHTDIYLKKKQVEETNTPGGAKFVARNVYEAAAAVMIIAK